MATSSEPGSLASGAVLAGRYRILEPLGKGGMGEVFLAEQIDLGRRVVIKVLHPRYANEPDALPRFRREARAAAGLNHPNVVQVTEFVTDPWAPAFLVMEYLEGCSLAEVLEQSGPLQPVRAVRIGLQILEGLEAAHDAGVVHRDLKPGNLMVLHSEGLGDVIKILDFGLARMLDDERRTRLTQTGQMLGTPAYMAPEQATGDPVDGRTDIYAVGLILYVALALRLPWSGKDPMERLNAMLRHAPEPLESLRSDLDVELVAIVHRAFARNPQERYQSTLQMRRALTRWLRLVQGEGAVGDPVPFGDSEDVQAYLRRTTQQQPKPAAPTPLAKPRRSRERFKTPAADADVPLERPPRPWLRVALGLSTVLVLLTLGLVLLGGLLVGADGWGPTPAANEAPRVAAVDVATLGEGAEPMLPVTSDGSPVLPPEDAGHSATDPGGASTSVPEEPETRVGSASERRLPTVPGLRMPDPHPFESASERRLTIPGLRMPDPHPFESTTPGSGSEAEPTREIRPPPVFEPWAGRAPPSQRPGNPPARHLNLRRLTVGGVMSTTLDEDAMAAWIAPILPRLGRCFRSQGADAGTYRFTVVFGATHMLSSVNVSRLPRELSGCVQGGVRAHRAPSPGAGIVQFRVEWR